MYRMSLVYVLCMSCLVLCCSRVVWCGWCGVFFRVKTRFEFTRWQSFAFVPNSVFPAATKSYHRKFQADLERKKTLLPPSL